MKAFGLALCIVSTAVLSGCVQIARGTAFAEAPTPAPSAEVATVYLWRESYDYGSSGANTFYLNGKEIVRLGDKQYTWLQIPPGEYTITEGRAVSANQVAIRAKAGATYYLSYEAVADGHQVAQLVTPTVIPIPHTLDVATGAHSYLRVSKKVSANYHLKRSRYVPSRL